MDSIGHYICLSFCLLVCLFVANDNNNDDNDNDDNNNYNEDSNDNKGISALGLDRDMGFLRGHQGCQGIWPHDDDDDDEQEGDDEVEDNDKDDNNNNDKGISALGLDRDLRFLRGHQGHRLNNDDHAEAR